MCHIWRICHYFLQMGKDLIIGQQQGCFIWWIILSNIVVVLLIVVGRVKGLELHSCTRSSLVVYDSDIKNKWLSSLEPIPGPYSLCISLTGLCCYTFKWSSWLNRVYPMPYWVFSTLYKNCFMVAQLHVLLQYASELIIMHARI